MLSSNKSNIYLLEKNMHFLTSGVAPWSSIVMTKYIPQETEYCLFTDMLSFNVT